MLNEHGSAVTARHGFIFGLTGGRAVPVVQLQAVVAQRLKLLVVLVVADADDGHLRCTESSQAVFRHPAIALPHLHVSIYALDLPTTSPKMRCSLPKQTLSTIIAIRQHYHTQAALVSTVSLE